MNTDTQPTNYDEINQFRELAYKNAAEKYRSLVQADSYKCNLEDFTELEDSKKSPSVLKVLSPLPAEVQKQIVNFVCNLVGSIPDEVFQELEPTNREELQGLIAGIYLKESEASEPLDEMYIRILNSFSRFYSIQRSEEISTLRFLEEYFSQNEEDSLYRDWNKRNALGNLLIKIVATTFPIYASYNVEAYYESYKNFQDSLKKEINTYRDAIEILLPNKKGKIRRSNYPVFTPDIKGYAAYSNIDAVTEMNPYRKGSARAITGGIDSVTGLNLTFTHLYQHEVKETADANSAKNRMKNTIYQQARTIVHEDIHQLGNHDFTGIFSILINELLTDTFAEHIQLYAHGEDVINADRSNRVDTGYSRLVRWARDLMEVGIISLEDLIHLSSNQDPEGFVKKLSNYASTREGAGVLIHTMRKNMLTMPCKSSAIENLINGIVENPAGEIEKMFLEAYSNFGTGMIMNIYGPYNIYQYLLKSHPDYLIKLRDNYAEKSGKNPQDIPIETSYFLLYDPDYVGVFSDEVLDFIDEARLAGDYKTIKYGKFLNSEDLGAFILGVGTNEINPLLPDLSLTPEESINIFLGIELTISNTNASYLSMTNTTKSDRVELLRPYVSKIYKAADKIVKDNYPNLPYDEHRNFIKSLLGESLKTMQLKQSRAVRDLEDIQAEILSRITILTQSDLSPNQILSYIGSIDIPDDLADSLQVQTKSLLAQL